MKCEWVSQPLGRIADFIDYRGKTPPKTTFGIPLVTAKIVKNNVIQEPTEFISADFYDDWMTRGIPEYGNVVFTTEAPMGEVAQIRTTEKLAFAQRIIILQGKSDVLDDTFLFYALQYEPNKKRIEARSSGTTVFGIKSAELKKVLIDIPDFYTQTRIANFLSFIDDKIALNTKINRNLEQMAQAIFKSWFVDFEPWGGVMPNDWRIGSISDMAEDIVCGKTPSTKVYEYFGEDVPFITIPDMHGQTYVTTTERSLSSMGAASQPNKTIPPNSVCVSCIATAGLVVLTAAPSQTNQQINTIVCKNNISPFYVYLSMVGMSERIKMLGSSGSATNNLNKRQFAKIETLIPENSAIDEFDAIVAPLFENIMRTQQESERLAALRDTLLPRLMSGEIKIPLEV